MTPDDRLYVMLFSVHGLMRGTRPELGRDADTEGLWYATGHGRNGVLLAAITGEIIAQLFTDAPIEYDIGPIDPARYWKTSRP